MIVWRSCEALSGVRFVQKYWSAFSPTTGIPSPARTFEISLSIAAQPPSPETKTTSVSDAPRVAGTSTSGSFGVDAESDAARASSSRTMSVFIRTGGQNSAPPFRIYGSRQSVDELNPAPDRLRGGRGRRSPVDHVREKKIRVWLLVGSESDDEITLRLREVFVGVAPRIAQKRRRKIERNQILKPRRKMSVDDVVHLEGFADLLDPFDGDGLSRFL